VTVVNPPIFIHQESHPADRWRRIQTALLGNRGGIFGQGHLVVTQNGTPNMTVNVAEGYVAVPGTEATYQGMYVCENQGVQNVGPFAASDPTNARRDLVVARVQDSNYSGGVRTWSLSIVQGTPSGSPVDPAVPANCWVLARVTIPALSTTIVDANILDFRTGGTGYTGQNGGAALLGGTIICTSTTRPLVPFEGMRIYELDTDQELVYSGSAWVVVSRLGAGIDFVPTLTQGVTVTKTTTYARYEKVGRWVTAQGVLACTSAGTANTAIQIGIPAGLTAVQTLVPVGLVWWIASGVYYPVPAALGTTTTFVGLILGSALNLGQTSGTFDNQIASGDTIAFNIRFEATT
jgi:hypothetical protein